MTTPDEGIPKNAGNLFGKLFPNSHIEALNDAIDILKCSLMLEAFQKGVIISGVVRQVHKADALQRLEVVVDSLDTVSDAPVSQAVAMLSCGCIVAETITDRIQIICEDHTTGIGDHEAIRGHITNALNEKLGEDNPYTMTKNSTKINGTHRDRIGDLKKANNEDAALKSRIDKLLGDVFPEGL